MEFRFKKEQLSVEYYKQSQKNEPNWEKSYLFTTLKCTKLSSTGLQNYKN